MLMRLAALACLLLASASFAGPTRMVEFDFSATLSGRAPSRGTVATLLDEPEPATIRIADERGQVHVLSFTVRGAGGALKLQSTLDGKRESHSLAAKPGARVTFDGTDGATVELTLVKLRPAA